MTSSPKKRGTYSDRKRLETTVYDGDVEMLKLIQSELGLSEADAVRTAIRTYAALLIQRKR